MKRENLLSYFGFALLLICFAVALWRVVLRPTVSAEDGVERIRFAHWQLEGGLREAFDKLAREYEALHPGVKVEQVAVPERTYAQWLRTQLVGETITELVQLGKGLDDELLARFFTPISEHVEQPNPYNAGTDLEGVAWRDTILDGMENELSYRSNLLEYYGIPISMFTVRMFYNRTLWEGMLGDTPTPTNYEEFLALCERVRELNEKTGRTIIPVAGSKDNAPHVLWRLFMSQVQRLNQRLDVLKTMRPTPSDAALALIRGDWTLDDPAYTSGLEIMRETAVYFQPGYSTLARDDASFHFLQHRALMIATGSWDSTSFRSQADFEIGVFTLPVPTTDHPRYGKHMYGPGSEAETGTSLSFGIPKQTKNFERALDFLHFLSSKNGNSTFSRESGWLPSVVGIAPSEHVRPFLPITDGYVSGFQFPMKIGPGNATLVINAANHLLVSPTGSVQAFKDAVQGKLQDALRRDLLRSVHTTSLNVNRQDVMLLAYEMLGEDPEISPAKRARKLSMIQESQNKFENTIAWTRHELERVRK